jgi:hypothetical protein
MENMARAVLWSVKTYYDVREFFKRFCTWKEEEVDDNSYSTRWLLCSPNVDEKYTSDTRESLCPDVMYPILIHEVISGNHVRCAVHWKDGHREPYHLEDLFNKVPAPWLFIGYRTSEGEVIDCTELLSEYVCDGNFIAQELLECVVPEGRGKKWTYIHPKTFEQTEFPSEGILIRDSNESSELDTAEGDKKND